MRTWPHKIAIALKILSSDIGMKFSVRVLVSLLNISYYWTTFQQKFNIFIAYNAMHYSSSRESESDLSEISWITDHTFLVG